jgi:hypothetical protein
MLTAAVSGSFHRHMQAITDAVHELAALSVRVLSPADPRVVAQQGEFLFVASDPVRSVRLVQDRHLESIRAANFVWLVCPDGHVGQSASMEIGFAAAVGVPIFAAQAPSDLTLSQYVAILPNLAAAVRKSGMRPGPRQRPGILIDPKASIAQAHLLLERIGTALARQTKPSDSSASARHDIAILQSRLSLPTYIH